MNWIQKYKAVIDMNEERITFRIDERKFTTKLVSDTKSQNKVHYYIMNESKDIIDLTLTKEDIIEVMKGDNESHFIIIESEEDSISSEDEIEMISGNLKGKFLNEAIAFYKAKC